MTVRTLRCTDNAYDQLLAVYGTDNAVWAAVFAVSKAAFCRNGEECLRELCKAHRINPDA